MRGNLLSGSADERREELLRLMHDGSTVTAGFVYCTSHQMTTFSNYNALRRERRICPPEIPAHRDDRARLARRSNSDDCSSPVKSQRAASNSQPRRDTGGNNPH